jgi:hypothetical protein
MFLKGFQSKYSFTETLPTKLRQNELQRLKFYSFSKVKNRCRIYLQRAVSLIQNLKFLRHRLRELASIWVLCWSTKIELGNKECNE